MERIAEPASRFHSDYLAYRQGDITRAELVARLPHIAMIGDSVCMDIYISSPWGTFWRAHTPRRNNWFFDLDPAPGIYSVSKALEAITPFVAIECAGVGALVDHEHGRQGLFRRILGTRNFSAQVAELLRARRFPDLILRSEEHTSELQSPYDLVCRLLPEKKRIFLPRRTPAAWPRARVAPGNIPTIT